MSDNADDGMFDEFADATEAKLSGFAEQIRGFRVEMERMREEQRSAPALAIQPIISEDAIAIRAAALVPPPVIDLDAIAKRAAELVPVPKDGKDAVVDYDHITISVRELVAAEVGKVPLPTIDTEALIPRIAALVPVPKDGEDGAASPDEIRAIAREEVLTNQRDFYKGVWVDGTEYRTADGVTWDGSMWFAQRDTSKKPGDNNTDWKLAVKKGRDGRK